MSTLKLGLHKLPAAEVVLIQTLLRLYGSGKDGARWAATDRPPWDALLVDATMAEPAMGEWAGQAAPVLRITRIGAADRPDTIERPIRPDKLLRWLDARHPAVPVSEKAEPAAPTVEAAASTPVPLAEVRYRLRRWPPSAVLRNDARRVRLATLLSKRAFNANELSSVSQQQPADCHAFLLTLRGTGLVEAEAASAVQAPAIVGAALKAPPPRKSAFGIAGGLIGGLRRRLGL